MAGGIGDEFDAHADLLDGAGVGLVIQASDGVVTRSNRTALELLSAAPDEGVVGTVITSWPDGLRTSSEVLRAPDGSVASIRTLITGDRSGRSDVALPSIELLTTIVDATPVGVCVTTEDGRFEHVNAAYERFYGYAAEELIGRHFTLVVPEAERAELSALHDRFMTEGADIRDEWRVVCKDGEQRSILADACRVVGADGRYRKVTFVVDITERTAMEAELGRANERLAHLATHDPLTGLANHRRSLDVLASAAQVAARYQRDLAVAVIDLDHFKAVNDGYGHRAGDDLLTRFADLLSAATRAADTAGRIGGEEFLLIMPETTTTEAAALLGRLRTACHGGLTTPGGAVVQFSAGIAAHEAGETPEAVLERADRALYLAKAEGRDRVAVG